MAGTSPQTSASAAAGKPSGKQVALPPQSSPVAGRKTGGATAATATLSIMQKPGLMAPAVAVGDAGNVRVRPEPGVRR